MTQVYLTAQDEQNYGRDLLDVSQRAALHAVAPALQDLQQANAELRQKLAVEARRNLDAAVAAAVPDYQTIDRDPRWHHWLLGIDALSGRPRQQLLNIAIAEGDSGRIATFFRGFQREVGDTAPANTPSARTRSSGRQQIYSRDQIKQLYESHRKGEWNGREAEWQRLEYELIAAGREGRILNPDIVTK